MEANSKPDRLERLPVSCRTARQSDTPQVLELTGQIWEGDDYIPFVWQDWLADPDGFLIVAENEGRVLGLGKLTKLSEEDWWMEGLRVHPAFEGRGIASQIFDCLFGHWLRIGAGIVRLATASTRYPVHHLCQRANFTKILELVPFAASAKQDRSSHRKFQRVSQAEVDEALRMMQQSQSLAILSQGLIELYWCWTPPRRSYLADLAEREQVWWWDGRHGLLASEKDVEEEVSRSFDLKFLVCPVDSLAACLEDFRNLAGELGYRRAVWNAPLHPRLLPLLEKSGFERAWEHSIFVYAKQHPGNFREG